MGIRINCRVVALLLFPRVTPLPMQASDRKRIVLRQPGDGFRQRFPCFVLPLGKRQDVAQALIEVRCLHAAPTGFVAGHVIRLIRLSARRR